MSSQHVYLSHAAARHDTQYIMSNSVIKRPFLRGWPRPSPHYLTSSTSRSSTSLLFPHRHVSSIPGQSTVRPPPQSSLLTCSFSITQSKQQTPILTRFDCPPSLEAHATHLPDPPLHSATPARHGRRWTECPGLFQDTTGRGEEPPWSWWLRRCSL